MRIKITGKITIERILSVLQDVYRRMPQDVSFKTANLYFNFEDEKGKNWFFTHQGQIVDLVVFEPDQTEGIPNPAPEKRSKNKKPAKLAEIDQKPITGTEAVDETGLKVLH